MVVTCFCPSPTVGCISAACTHRTVLLAARQHQGVAACTVGVQLTGALRPRHPTRGDSRQAELAWLHHDGEIVYQSKRFADYDAIIEAGDCARAGVLLLVRGGCGGDARGQKRLDCRSAAAEIPRRRRTGAGGQTCGFKGPLEGSVARPCAAC